MEKYCSFCGTKLRENSNFCEGCGRKIKDIEEKPFKKDLIKYLLLISTVICLISIVLPWGTVHYIGTEINFYTWSIQTIYGSENTIWGYITDPSSLTNLFTNNEVNTFAFPLALWFGTFAITIIIIILGISAIFTKNIQKYNYPAVSGGLAILSLIFFFIFINFGFFPSKAGLNFRNYFSWSYGFFLMLLSGILFFVSFFVDKYFLNNERVQGSEEEKK